MNPTNQSVSRFISFYKSLPFYKKRFLLNPFRISAPPLSSQNGAFSCREFARGMCHRPNCKLLHGVSHFKNSFVYDCFGDETVLLKQERTVNCVFIQVKEEEIIKVEFEIGAQKEMLKEQNKVVNEGKQNKEQWNEQNQWQNKQNLKQNEVKGLENEQKRQYNDQSNNLDQKEIQKDQYNEPENLNEQIWQLNEQNEQVNEQNELEQLNETLSEENNTFGEETEEIDEMDEIDQNQHKTEKNIDIEKHTLQMLQQFPIQNVEGFHQKGRTFRIQFTHRRDAEFWKEALNWKWIDNFRIEAEIGPDMF
ncbi:Hypothetical_protein [Hexamita inflata]|uniref:Hypothetical_protein n=1 Tax=Hexamita inflata TaxID=28002 RepID=A0AA86NG59_9EUKA|nr:Hypothetical protein HINF_LOCUS6128 [Hexamita inflata]